MSQRLWTAMRLRTGILYSLRRNRIAVLGARSAPKRYCETSQGRCRDIKGRALGWLATNGDELTRFHRRERRQDLWNEWAQFFHAIRARRGHDDADPRCSEVLLKG